MTRPIEDEIRYSRDSPSSSFLIRVSSSSLFTVPFSCLIRFVEAFDAGSAL